jgi:hypothetical protein
MKNLFIKPKLILLFLLCLLISHFTYTQEIKPEQCKIGLQIFCSDTFGLQIRKSEVKREKVNVFTRIINWQEFPNSYQILYHIYTDKNKHLQSIEHNLHLK